MTYYSKKYASILGSGLKLSPAEVITIGIISSVIIILMIGMFILVHQKLYYLPMTAGVITCTFVLIISYYLEDI